MKFTENYIKMCSEAEEIQYLEFGKIAGDGENLKSQLKDNVWLPRQDQLQEMSRLNWVEFDRQCREKVEFHISGDNIFGVKENSRLNYNGDETKEEIGLRVVMEILYNKKWDGEGWIEITEKPSSLVVAAYSPEVETW
jgi:hypothetical protein